MTTTQTDLADEGAVPTSLPATSGVPGGARPAGSTLPRVVRAELIKLRSLRSTGYALAVAALSILAMATITAVGVVSGQEIETGGGDPSSGDPTGGALSGVNIAYFAVATLGVLTVTGEYASAMVRSTMVAVPRRSRLVVGKALAVASVTLPVTVVSTVVAFFAARAVLATADISVSFTAPGVARAVLGAGLYLTGLAVLGTGFGWFLRSTAGALATLFAVLIVVPTFGLLLPQDVADRVLPYLPDNAGQAIMATTASSGQLAPWAGLAVFVAWIVVTVTGAALLVRRRDV